jgi:hypothetical protein
MRAGCEADNESDQQSHKGFFSSWFTIKSISPTDKGCQRIFERESSIYFLSVGRFLIRWARKLSAIFLSFVALWR